MNPSEKHSLYQTVKQSMKRNTGFPNQYVSGVVALTTEAALKKMSPEDRAIAEEQLAEQHYWEAERQIAEQDARYQYENPENTLTNR